jgi:hypothetical protein
VPLEVALGGGDRDIFVDIVETDVDEADDADRILFEAPLTSGSSPCLSCFRPLSSSSLASCSSATPFLKMNATSVKFPNESHAADIHKHRRRRCTMKQAGLIVYKEGKTSRIVVNVLPQKILRNIAS